MQLGPFKMAARRRRRRTVSADAALEIGSAEATMQFRGYATEGPEGA